MRALLPALLPALLLAAPAFAQKPPNRTADFAGLDGARAATLAAEIAMPDVSPDPAPPPFAVSVEPGAAHIVQPVGLACTGQRLRVDPAGLFQRLAPPPADAVHRLTVTSGRAFRRCVTITDLKQRCLITTEFDARLEAADGSARPLAVSVTRDHGAGATCRRIPEGTALATREAAIALLAAAAPGTAP
jgi:hypothetical protein